MGCSCPLLELDIVIWAISQERVSIQRKFTRRQQASGLAVELPTRVKATGPGMQARGAVQSQSGLGRGRALPARPLSAPPLFLAQGRKYVLWMAVCPENLGPGHGPLASTNRERDPACLASTTLWEAAFLTTPVWWFSNSKGPRPPGVRGEASERRLLKGADPQVHPFPPAF